MSSARQVRILPTENLRIPEEGSSAQGKSGPKARAKAVVDGQQVEIPALQYDRTVGTHVESAGAERKAACKRSSSMAGKPAMQCEGVMRTEV